MSSVNMASYVEPTDQYSNTNSHPGLSFASALMITMLLCIRGTPS